MADVTDRYGTDLALDPATGDLVVWPNGALGTVSDTDNCIQALKLRILAMEGDLPLHPSYGSRFQQLVGIKRNPDRLRAEANLLLREILEEDARFLSAKDLRVIDLPPNTAAIQFALALAGGERLQVADLVGGRIDEIVAPEFADSLEAIALAEDLDFITQDEAELAELADYNAAQELLAPPATAPYLPE